MSHSKKIKRITKAVIPIAGLGTRMLPATKAIPKEMLPLVDKPLIQYVINECVASGINQIVFVTHASKNSIENHFDTSFELESILEQRVKRQLLNEITDICPKQVTIMSVRQGVAKGLGHAILCAQPIVGNNPIAVILPDIVVTSAQDLKIINIDHTNLEIMLERFYRTGISQVMIHPVPSDMVTQYGIIDNNKLTVAPGEWTKVTHIVEKPKVCEAPSNLAVVGRYVFDECIWRVLEQTLPYNNTEIQLTDAITKLLDTHPLEGYRLIGTSYDCGNKLGYMKAFVEHGIHHKELGNQFNLWLQQKFSTSQTSNK